MLLHFDINKYWNQQYKLIQQMLNTGIESQGDVLEYSGLYLAMLAKGMVHPIFSQVVDGLYGLLVPGRDYPALTKFYGDTEPHESKPNRWKLIHGMGKYEKDQVIIYIDDLPAEWLRVDTSHAQWWYVVEGLLWIYERTHYKPAKDLFDILMAGIIKNKYRIKEGGNKGNFLTWFFPVGAPLLRAFWIAKYAGKKLPFLDDLRARLAIRSLFAWVWVAKKLTW